MVVISTGKPGRLVDLGKYLRFNISRRVFNLTRFAYMMELWIVYISRVILPNELYIFILSLNLISFPPASENVAL